MNGDYQTKKNYCKYFLASKCHSPSLLFLKVLLCQATISWVRICKPFCWLEVTGNMIIRTHWLHTTPVGILLIFSFHFFVCFFVSYNRFSILALMQKSSLIMVVSQLIPSFAFLFSQFASQSKISLVLKPVSTEQISRIKCTYTSQKTCVKISKIAQGRKLKYHFNRRKW